MPNRSIRRFALTAITVVSATVLTALGAMRRARRLLSLPARRDMKRILPVVTALAAIGCALSAAPALASQPSAAHPAAVAAAHPGHAVVTPDIPLTEGCNVQACFLEDAAGTLFPAPGGVADFLTPILGHVGQDNSCWPFSQCGFDTRYSGREVLEFVATNDDNQCMQTDSVHSGVSLKPCVAHDAGDYWVAVGNGGGRGVCSSNAVWLVNVGFTNHYLTYPNAAVMFFNSADNGENVATNLSISNDDQWCVYH
jgi:hypothetical protein